MRDNEYRQKCLQVKQTDVKQQPSISSPEASPKKKVNTLNVRPLLLCIRQFLLNFIITSILPPQAGTVFVCYRRKKPPLSPSDTS
eukprot:1141354-Pelagomonas_calceolata.AAC.2